MLSPGVVLVEGVAAMLALLFRYRHVRDEPLARFDKSQERAHAMLRHGAMVCDTVRHSRMTKREDAACGSPAQHRLA